MNQQRTKQYAQNKGRQGQGSYCPGKAGRIWEVEVDLIKGRVDHMHELSHWKVTLDRDSDSVRT